jgi:hypothetical protein
MPSAAGSVAAAEPREAYPHGIPGEEEVRGRPEELGWWRGWQIPGTDLWGDLWGCRVTALQSPHESHLFLQVVEPETKLSLTAAENEEGGG